METPYYVDWIAHHARVNPNKTAAIDLESHRRQSYSEMNKRVGSIAAFLVEKGIKKGDRIGFLAMNSTDILDIIFATWRIGGISLALNYRLTAHELDYIIKDASPDLLFYDHELDALVSQLKSTTNITNYVGLDGVGGTSDLETAVSNHKPVYESVSQTMNDQCMLMYSSGTTGHPKGVIITHNMIFYSAVNCINTCLATAKSVWLTMMPLFHVGGLNITGLPPLLNGGTTVVMRAFNPESVLDAFSDPELSISHTLGVPAMYNAMRITPKAETANYSRLETALVGGAPAPMELMQWWHARGLSLQDGYGMTESTASNCISSKDDVPHRIGTSGKALMHTEMKIMDVHGQEVPRMELGEIWMRGPTITPGYWNNPEANSEAFVDGWFRSGDIALQDKDGYFIIQDRAKDMYISGGENVYPAEVENILSEIPIVQEVAVIGVPDEKWGETGCAVIVLKSGTSLTLEDIHAHCKTKLARYKQPTYCVVLDELPRNATGKVKKFELRQTIPDLLAS